jgi:ribosome production factor 2
MNDLGLGRQLDAVKLTRKNADVRPFETGGEAQLEYLGRRADAGLFAVGTTSKKRPDNMTLGGSLAGPVFLLIGFHNSKLSSLLNSQ